MLKTTDFSFTAIDNKAIITGCNYMSKEIIIPELITSNGKDLSVVEIADRAFYDHNEIVSVSIPSTVSRVGRQAFSHCDNLTDMRLEDGNNIIMYDDIDFDEYSPPIKHLYLGRNLIAKDSDFSPFNSCPTLTEITIGDLVTFIGESAFIDCVNIKVINFGKNLRHIKCGAFMNSLSLESIKLPPNLAIIDAMAFSGCEKLSKITLPPNTAIATNAFEHCPCVNTTLELARSIYSQSKK